jgi:chitinase
LADGISYCRKNGKKILLSLGGAAGTIPYQLTCNADAEYMANFLWGAFGPLQAGNTWPRPFDDQTVGSQSVDGFDFDIEAIQPGKSAPVK